MNAHQRRILRRETKRAFPVGMPVSFGHELGVVKKGKVSRVNSWGEVVVVDHGGPARHVKAKFVRPA